MNKKRIREACRIAFLSVFAALMGLAAAPANAAKTTSWTTTSPNSSTTSNGVVVQMNPSVAFTAAAAGTMSTTNYWNDPFAVAPLTSIPGSADLNFTVAPSTTQTITITFNKAVDNPVVHIQRLGGSNAGVTNSSNWALTGSNLGTLPTVTRLSGNPQFQVAGNAFFRTAGLTASATAGCSVASASAVTDDGTNGCGSVRVNGTGITSLSYTVTFVGGVGLGDGVEMVWSIGGSTVAIRKQSTFGTRVFSFTGTNGVTSATLDTAVANPQTSGLFNVTNHAQQIQITEGSVTDYVLTGATCADQNATTVASSLSGLTLTIAASAYRANQNIICTFNNRRTPAVDLTIQKSDGVTSAILGSTVTYSVLVTNTGPDAAVGPIITDTVGTHLNCPGTNSVVITGSGVPAGSFTIANLTGAGITLGTLASGQSATLTYSCQVN